MAADLKVYVGYDSREDIAWKVCRSSLLRHCPEVSVYPLKQGTLRELGLYTRPVDATATTEFSITRFLTPYLGAHDGWTIFVDCDFLFTTSIAKVLEGLDRRMAVYVVKHDYNPRFRIKMDGKEQTQYPRKNWSSFVVFNGLHPDVKALSPSVVNSATPSHLHRFGWIKNDAEIGDLPLSWNFLVGEYDPPAEIPNAIHFTNGGPWFSKWQDADYSTLWKLEHKRLEDGSAAR